MKTSPLVLALLACGCTVGPNFTPPAAPAVAGYIPPREATPQSMALGQSVTAEWWTLFRAPGVDALVKQAINGSPTLAGATARVNQAQEELTRATGAIYPALNLQSSVTREKLNAASFGLEPGTFPLPPNANVYQIEPMASYDLDLFGGTRRRIEQATALAQLQRYQLAAAYQTLTADVVSEAVALAAARARRRALQDIMKLDQQSVHLVHVEAEGGQVPDTDLVSEQSQLAADQTLVPGPDQQIDVADHALAVLIGRAPGDWSPPGVDLSALTLPGEIPVSLPSALVHQRPDILAAEARLHAASAAVGVATAQLYPSITLSASAATVALQPTDLFSPASLAWSIAAGLTAPIYDGGMRQAERRASLAAFKAAAADYQQTVLRAFGQVADAMQALAHDGELAKAEQQALNEASDSLRLERIAYRGGGIGVLPLLDAQRQYQQAELATINAEAQRFQDAAQLLVAMGGGWWADDQPMQEPGPLSRAPSP